MATKKPAKKATKTAAKKDDYSVEIREVGRPPFVVTEAKRKAIIEMACNGIKQETIALFIGCSVDTLHKYFDEDFKMGQAVAINEVAKSLYQNAKAGDFKSQQFYLQTRAGWKITTANEVTGKDGGAIDITDSKARLLAGLKLDGNE